MTRGLNSLSGICGSVRSSHFGYLIVTYCEQYSLCVTYVTDHLCIYTTQITTTFIIAHIVGYTFA